MVALPSLAFPTQWRYGYTLVGVGGGGGGGGGGLGKLELEVSSIIFCFVLALLTAYLFFIGLYWMHVLADSRQ